VSSAGWWFVAALALGIAELALPGVFLVFLALAAAITGAALLALDLPLVVQLAAFGVWSVVAVLIGRRWYGDYPVSADAQLNDRTARLIGQVVQVETPIVGGRGRVHVGDGSWPASGPDAAAGKRVRIVAVDGGLLVVEHAEQSPSSAIPVS
jgi:membrane protein implicated in regulation of membrane protease activity